MPQRIISNSFVGGEISPELYGRHDLKVYFNGAASLENFIVRRTGGIRKRAGTEVLFTLDADTSPDNGTLDNKFKFFPYFYGPSIFGLLVLRLTDDDEPVLQSKLIIREETTSDMTEWTALPISTGITETASLDDLRCKQVGDTLFFTRIGYQAFTCRITMVDRTTEFMLLDNFVNVPVPAAIRATPKAFYPEQTYNPGDVDQIPLSGITKITKYYALFGVKDGILSKPSTAQCQASSPWSPGATITVRGTLDFSLHDYYILAKKAGMNYGKLSEIYPQEMVDAAEPEYVDGTGDFAYRDATTGGVFCDDETKFLNGDPDLKASSTPTLKLSERAMAIRATEVNIGGTDKYRFATPHFMVDFGTASTKYAHFTCTPYAVRLDTMKAQVLPLANTEAVITPHFYTDDGASITAGTPVTKTSGNTGLFSGISLGSQSGIKRMVLVIEIAKTANTTKLAGDSLFVGGVSVTTTANPANAGAVYSGLDDDTEDQALITVPAALSADPLATTVECLPSVISKFNSIRVSTMWNLHDPVDLFCETKLIFKAAYAKTLVSMTLDTTGDFHINGAYMSKIDFTVPEKSTNLSTIDIHIGNVAIKYEDGSALAMPSQKLITCTLSTVVPDPDGINPDTVSEVGTFSMDAGLIETKKISIVYPDDVAAAEKYRLEFSETVRVRGISVQSISSVLNFVDDNINPGEVTGQQTMLEVGDDNMDCDLFDVFEQRAVYAVSHELPFSLWFSVVGDLYNFYAFRPQADDDAFTVTIPAKKASRIIHMIADKEMMLFTEDGVYLVDSEGGSGFSFRTVRMRKICNATSSEDVHPIKTDGKTIFVGEDGRTVYELKYDLMSDAIMPTDRSVMAYHLTETAKIVKIAYQRFPDSIIWFLLDDGNLVSMTYMPDHEVYGWSHHTIAATDDNQQIVDMFDVGSLVTGDGIETTNDIVMVCETYDGDGNRDAKTVIERMRPNVCADVLTLGDDNNDCTDHLDGDYPADVTATLRTLRPESPEFNSQGVPKRVVDVCLRLRRAGLVSVVPYVAGLSVMTGAGATEDATAGTLTLYSGDVKIMPRGYINDDGQMVIASSDAKPCEILSAVYVVDLPS